MYYSVFSQQSEKSLIILIAIPIINLNELGVNWVKGMAKHGLLKAWQLISRNIFTSIESNKKKNQPWNSEGMDDACLD
jgi:hypothetical protein